MTRENFNELVNSDVNKIIKQMKEYKRLLKSGISYDEIIAFYNMDKDIFQFSDTGKYNIGEYIEIFNFLNNIEEYDPISMEPLEIFCIKENEKQSIQTKIRSQEDARDTLLAINLAYEFLNEELKEKEEKSLKMLNDNK